MSQPQFSCSSNDTANTPNQKKVDSPLFTSLLINLEASGRSLSNLCQSQELLFESFSSQNDPPPKGSAPTQRDPNRENNRHIRPRAKTLDVSLSFRIPEPPSHLGKQRSFQATFPYGEHLASQTTKTHCTIFQFHPNKPYWQNKSLAPEVNNTKDDRLYQL